MRTTASISSASIAMNLTCDDVAPIAIMEKFNLPLVFSDVSNLQRINGSYTPNNDELVLHTFSANDQANFILLVVDQPANLYVGAGALGWLVQGIPIQRAAFFGFEDIPLSQVMLYGVTTAPVPMQQATPCYWTMIYGVATIT